MSSRAAVSYGGVLGLGGLSLLWVTSSRLSFVIVLAGFAIYVGVYTLYLKRRSLCATLVGSLAGAAPALAGYCAVGGRFDLGALLIVAIYCLWQIPHSYAIAVFRFNDYKVAAIPVLPVIRGIGAARRQMTGYIMAFTVVALLLTISGYTGFLYLAVVAGLGFTWLFLAVWRGGNGSDDRVWAKRLFVFSILCMIALNVMMAFDAAVIPASPLQPPSTQYSVSSIAPVFK